MNNNKYNGASYSALVNREIRRKYTADEEFAILRQKDRKPEEYAAYDAYCEECKATISKMLEEENS